MAPGGVRRRDLLIGGAALATSPFAAFAQEAGDVRVEMRTGAGLIVMALHQDKAPITTGNFLRYVADRLYDRSFIYRAMRAVGAPDTGIIQGGARFDPARPHKPIPHESTLKTGLRHKDGTVSLARRAPGTATSDFFICIGDQPSFDAHPEAPGDNLGFAAFGDVIEGMDVVRAILAMPTSPTKGPPGMVGQMLDPKVPIITTRRVSRS